MEFSSVRKQNGALNKEKSDLEISILASLGAYFGSKLKKYMKARPSGQSNALRILLLSIQVFFFILVGTVVFILIPAAVFTTIEDSWTYLDSVYFAFITLTTIGFGDFVTGRDKNVLDKMGDYKVIYEIAVVVWIIFGLGYVFMIINVISQGMKAPARRAAKRLALAEKALMAKVLEELVVIKSDKRSKPETEVIEGGEDVPDQDPMALLNSQGFKNEAYTESPVRETAPNAKKANVDEMIEEMNHDTITSLRNFVTSAAIINRSIASRQNSIPNGNNDSSSTVPVSRSSSISVSSRMTASEAANSNGGPPARASGLMGRSTSTQEVDGGGRDGWRRIFNRRLSIRSIQNQQQQPRDLASVASMLTSNHRDNTVSLPDILRDTTLQEFLQAFENVRSSEAGNITQLTDDVEDEGGAEDYPEEG